ncbi:MAG: porin [Chitinophagaceae bacterium]|nr:porin [Chitinophagaceae bacterium]
MDMVDTTKDMGKGMLSLFNRLDKIRFSGYIQPQFQVSGSKGAKGYSGGDFSTNSNNRFMLRRARVRIDYVHFPKSTKGPSLQFVFQFDATERGVNVRDVWGRFFENKFQLFTLTAGLFARPFSYELNLSSGDRESPERGRMSQILMKTERDMGVMLSFEPRKKDSKLKFLKADIGIFNGPGLSATADYDSHKDLIGRITIKPQNLSQKISLGAAVSLLYGGLSQNTKYVYTTTATGGVKSFTVDSSSLNLGKVAPRHYYGADLQLKLKNKKGFSEFRAEYMMGKQSASATSSETPGAAFAGTEGYYVRKFNGAYFWYLQHLGSTHHQLIIKYDWYDPNTDVQKTDIGKPGANINAANIKYSTLGFGYAYYITENAKLVLYYDRVFNEKTQLAGFTGDLKDDVFTCRLQFRF